MFFADRRDAGRQLAAQLAHLRGSDPVVLGLPRGGVPVASEVARMLDAPLDVIIVRKLGAPGQPELAMGAVGEGGVTVLNDRIVRSAQVPDAAVAEAVARERAEIEQRTRRYRGNRPPLLLADRVAVIVDDGLATGATARAACQVARARAARRVVVAAPVSSAEAIELLRRVADEVVCLRTPPSFAGVGAYYGDFSPTTDHEVVTLLGSSSRSQDVALRAGGVVLAGRLTQPAEAPGLVLFVHGSGSSRHSPRNRFVADALHDAGLATLLFDLLTPDEEGSRRLVFDVPLLAERLRDVTREMRSTAAWVGYFGASTGAAAALWAAAEPDADIAAVVSRGGRPDLAGERLDAVRAPTLLIVGSRDVRVLELNRQAQQRMRCPSRLDVVEGAGHLFEEPGTLAQAAALAADWFVTGARSTRQ